MKRNIKSILSFVLVEMLRIKPESLLYFVYYVQNIRPGHDNRKNGELYLIERIKRYFSDREEVVVFDVGANDGSYSKLVGQTMPNAVIYAFEPNHELVRKSNYGSARVFVNGLGDKNSGANLYLNAGGEQEASVYQSVFKFHNEDASDQNQIVLDIDIRTLKDFCAEKHIQHIDFLKIDTEGHELSVLLGGEELLSENRISIIQFEFNEMNVFSRVFLRDFYELLSKNYNFYRLQRKGLFPLGSYKSHNEIFVWHNLVAVNKQIENNFLLS